MIRCMETIESFTNSLQPPTVTNEFCWRRNRNSSPFFFIDTRYDTQRQSLEVQLAVRNQKLHQDQVEGQMLVVGDAGD